MDKTKISAEIVADSVDSRGNRLTSLLITFPRIILAEVNTHRMLSKNTSSSRAIPYKKMVEAVRENPFIPIAWQKYHPGMQGSEYHSKTDLFELEAFVETMHYTFKKMVVGENISEKEYKKLEKRLQEKVNLISRLLKDYINDKKTLDDWWLFARDKAIEAASILYVFDVTKQLCNRLLEPFMWTTMLITGSKQGWDNFFELRCPRYFGRGKSWKETCQASGSTFEATILERLQNNKGQAEIHMMDLAEKIYDAMNGSTPKQLQAGEWHIPFENKIDIEELAISQTVWDIQQRGMDGLISDMIKISTAMGAYTSYTVVGGEAVRSYEKWIDLHDRLIAQDPPHSSPLEHCARAMSHEEYKAFIKGEGQKRENGHYKSVCGSPLFNVSAHGWCGPYKGFISYRYLLEEEELKL